MTTDRALVLLALGAIAALTWRLRQTRMELADLRGAFTAYRAGRVVLTDG